MSVTRCAIPATLWGVPTDLDFVLHEPDAVIAAAEAAGLVDIEWYGGARCRRRRRRNGSMCWAADRLNSLADPAERRSGR